MKSEDPDKTISHLFRQHRMKMTYTMPDGLKSEILKSLSSRPEAQFSFLSWMSFGGGAVAACLALIMSFQLGKMSASGPGNQVLLEEIVSSHVRSLMAEHLSDVISTDQHTVKPWFEGKIDFGPTVKNFVEEGFPLAGGRLEYIEGRPVAALIYKANQHVINLLQYPAPVSESSEFSLKSMRGYQIFSWTKEGMHYWAVSDLNAADLQKFVSLWP